MAIKDLVEQITVTTGTGTYTVSGTVDYRRTFLSAWSSNQTGIPCVVVDTAGNFECGIYDWNSGAGTLARTVILTSSNANAAVSWAAGDKKIYAGSSSLLATLVGVRHNLAALTTPTATDDSSLGYGVGSLWRDGEDTFWICRAANVASANWMVIIAHDPTSSIYTDRSIDSKERQIQYFSRGFNLLMGTDSSTSYGEVAYGGLYLKTTDATPDQMQFIDGAYHQDGIILYENCSATITGSVTAIDHATGDTRAWAIQAVAKVNASGTVTIAVGGSPTSLYNDGGASTWDCDVVAIGSYARVGLQVTGEAATTITWSAQLAVSNALFY